MIKKIELRRTGGRGQLFNFNWKGGLRKTSMDRSFKDKDFNNSSFYSGMISKGETKSAKSHTFIMKYTFISEIY